MIINILICIAAIMLFYKGGLLLLKTKLIWMLYDQIMESYSMKVTGRIVDIEVKTKTNGNNGPIMVKYPIVEYKRDEEKEMYRHSAGYDIVVEADNRSHMLYAQKFPHKGDKVTILYDSDSLDRIFAFPNMPFTRLLCRLFLPGCIYILAGILGVCYVFV